MLAAIIAAVAVILDQISKYIVVQNIEYRGSLPFIPKIISFYHTRNTGAAFSMLSDHRWVYMALSLVSMGVIVYLLYTEYKRHPLMNISLAMVLGGGIGNMIDRVRLEYVVDFLKLEFMDFAIFNVADCFVTVGAALLAIYIVFFEPKVEKRLKEAALAAANESSAPVAEDGQTENEDSAEAANAIGENTEEQTENE